MVRAILFDFDGVLTIDKTGSRSIIKYLSEKTSLSYDLIFKSYYKYNKNLLLGKINHQDMWREFCIGIGKNLDISLLKDAFLNIRLDFSMLDYLSELKNQYKIALVTDNKVDRINMIFKHFNLYCYFDVISISAEYGSSKENKFIFEQTLKKLSLQPNECVFIDNKENNLIAPKSMGINTIWFDDGKCDIFLLRNKINEIETK